MFKKISLVFVLLFTLVGCGGGDSDSGSMVEPTVPGDSLPANFVGTYTGTLTATARALGLSQTDTFPITIVVTEDGEIRFEGDDPDETFTAAVANDGSFAVDVSASDLDSDIDECDSSTSISVTGQVDGTTASGDIEGEGRCSVDGITADIELSGSFTATK